MRKNSALVKRAALLAAIAVAIAVAVGLSVFFVVSGGQAPSAAREGVWIPLVSGAAGLLCALAAIWLMAEKLMKKAQEPVEKLRDAAVAMSEGDLDVRADESAEGEVGQVAKAVSWPSTGRARSPTPTRRWRSSSPGARSRCTCPTPG